MHRRAALLVAIVAMGALALPAAAAAPASHTPAQFISGVFRPGAGASLEGIVLAKALSADEARVDTVLLGTGPGVGIVASAARCSQGHTAADQVLAFRLGSAATRKVDLSRPLDEARSLRIRVSGEFVQCTRARAFERVEQGSSDADSAFSRFINVQIVGFPEFSVNGIVLMNNPTQDGDSRSCFVVRGLEPNRVYTLIGTTYGGDGQTAFMHTFRTNGAGAHFAPTMGNPDLSLSLARARLYRGRDANGFEVASRAFVNTNYAWSDPSVPRDF